MYNGPVILPHTGADLTIGVLGIGLLFGGLLLLRLSRLRRGDGEGSGRD
jgi:LPXTG-motif cell wall-anchored protein